MTRQLEAHLEKSLSRRNLEIAFAANGGLEAAVEQAGAVLEGFSASFRGTEVLLTLRVELAGRRQICFVGSEDLGGCLRKAVRLGNADGLKFKPDKYAEG